MPLVECSLTPLESMAFAVDEFCLLGFSFTDPGRIRILRPGSVIRPGSAMFLNMPGYM